MSFLRKILVAMLALASVVGIYVLYRRSGAAPVLEARRDANSLNADVTGRDGVAGKIGPATITTLKGPKYVTRNKETKEIEREFGFADLVRTMGDVWEVEKPWMNMYQSKLEVRVHADKGTTEIETVVGSSTPKDATFVGNVVIEVIPVDANDYKHTTIYLDSLIFLSDKSEFSTPGPVKLVSEDVQMTGRGLKFVYNDWTDRLDYLRLNRLDYLRIKTAEEPVASKAGGGDADRQVASTADEPNSAKPEVAVDTPKPPPSTAPSADVTPPQAQKTPTADSVKPSKAEYYKCILSRNVLIDTPDELVFVRDDVHINDIIWSKGPAEIDVNSLAPDKTAGVVRIEKTQDLDSESPAQKTEIDKPIAGEPAPDAAPIQTKVSTEPNLPRTDAGKALDITVTCDNGILLLPMDSRRTPEDFFEIDTGISNVSDDRPGAFDDPNGRSTFVTQRIAYNAVTEDADANGPSELVFHTGDMTALDPNETSVPVTVKADIGVKFFKASSLAVFEGNCLLTMPQQDLSQPRDVTFSGKKFSVTVPDKTSRESRLSGDVVADGPVELIFYVEDSNAADANFPDANSPPIPVRITAQKQARFLPDANQVIFDGNCICSMEQEDTHKGDNFTLSSPSLIANLPKKAAKGTLKVPDVVAPGPVKLDFYVAAMDSNDPNAEPLPATVTAERQAHFTPSANQIIFEGACKSVVLDRDPNYLQQYILSSEYITVDLPVDTNDKATSKSEIGIQHLSARGGVVTLATKKTAGELLLSGIELICRKFDYDPIAQFFSVDGPGVIKLANTEPPDPNKDPGKLSLNKPCWAIIQNYDYLTYSEKKNIVIAEAGDKGAILVEYFPIENGEFADHIVVTANKVEASLIKTALGRTELSTLVASGGVTYQAKDNEFIGGTLFYDHAKQVMKITGSESFPCQFNGALADEIVYDLKTGKVEAELVGPGALRIK
ncbi:MAG: hypothetical protein JW720_06205 [Sedimentisphaerales bacterium]|nr:hypothetical protein [Sedimentisphaerales bacterium]